MFIWLYVNECWKIPEKEVEAILQRALNAKVKQYFYFGKVWRGFWVTRSYNELYTFRKCIKKDELEYI